MEDKRIWRMKANARIFREQGKENFSKDKFSILEMIKNSYDAGATKVSIEINEKERSITIEDNGIGFSKKGFENFLSVSETSKIQNELFYDIDGKSRRKLGNKGNGLYSFIRLGSVLTINSNDLNSSDSINIILDLNKIKLESKSKIREIYFEEIENTNFNKKGTKITIKSIKEDNINYYSIYKDIKNIIKFITLNENFKVKLELIKTSEKSFFENKDYIVESINPLKLIKDYSLKEYSKFSMNFYVSKENNEFEYSILSNKKWNNINKRERIPSSILIKTDSFFGKLKVNLLSLKIDNFSQDGMKEDEREMFFENKNDINDLSINTFNLVYYNDFLLPHYDGNGIKISNKKNNVKLNNTFILFRIEENEKNHLNFNTERSEIIKQNENYQIKDAFDELKKWMKSQIQEKMNEIQIDIENLKIKKESAKIDRNFKEQLNKIKITDEIRNEFLQIYIEIYYLIKNKQNEFYYPLRRIVWETKKILDKIDKESYNNLYLTLHLNLRVTLELIFIYIIFNYSWFKKITLDEDRTLFFPFFNFKNEKLSFESIGGLIFSTFKTLEDFNNEKEIDKKVRNNETFKKYSWKKWTDEQIELVKYISDTFEESTSIKIKKIEKTIDKINKFIHNPNNDKLLEEDIIVLLNYFKLWLEDTQKNQRKFNSIY